MFVALVRNLSIGAFCLFSITACGFSPVFAPGSESNEYLSDITYAPPNNRLSYLLVRRMEERLGRNLQASKILRYEIHLEEEGYELAPGRIQRVGKLNYQLVSKDDQRVLLQGQVESFTSFTNAGALINADRRYADERLIVILADKLVTDLIAKQAHQ
ncbi:MAG: hypothetical protein RLQ73_02500 [Hoeflea sp. D1-CHI-28]